MDGYHCRKLSVPRLGNTYRHYGLGVSDDRVIHYAGGVFERKNARIRITTLDEFARASEITVHDYRPRYEEDTVLNRANSRLGENKYSLLNNNCEHFVNWTMTGEHSSQQVDDLLENIEEFSSPIALLIKMFWIRDFNPEYDEEATTLGDLVLGIALDCLERGEGYDGDAECREGVSDLVEDLPAVMRMKGDKHLVNTIIRALTLGTSSDISA